MPPGGSPPTTGGCFNRPGILSQATSFDPPASIMSNLAPAQDTIRIAANTTIAKGASLAINAGKAVRVGQGRIITVYGALRILGTKTDSVRIEPIHANTSSQPPGFGHGGAISVKNSGFLITHSQFDSNRDSSEAGKGGAICWNDGVAEIRNSCFEYGNSAFNSGDQRGVAIVENEGVVFHPRHADPQGGLHQYRTLSGRIGWRYLACGSGHEVHLRRQLSRCLWKPTGGRRFSRSSGIRFRNWSWLERSPGPLPKLERVGRYRQFRVARLAHGKFLRVFHSPEQLLCRISQSCRFSRYELPAYANAANAPAIKQSSGELRVCHSTIADNAYYGTKIDYGHVTLRNSILWGNYGGSGIPQMDIGSSINSTVANSILQTGWIGTAIQDADPRFKDPASGDSAWTTAVSEA